jgi:phospholipid-binding lipoprotein MlaA
MSRSRRVSLLPLCLLLLCGCATLPPGSKRDARDPWERMNRATYTFNDKFDHAIAQPVARGYRKVTPHFMQTGVRNFMDNLNYPITMVNDLLQGQFKPFLNDFSRLLLNTTIGLGGLLDPATAAGLDKNDRDFGQTFGKWGISKGPYVVLPFLGPSDVRDGIGRLGNVYATPRHYLFNSYWDWGLYLVDAVDARARLLDATKLLESAYDPYAFLRNAYLQNRDFKVHGDQSHTQEQDQEDKLMQELEQEDSGAAPPQSSPPQAQPPPQSKPQP